MDFEIRKANMAEREEIKNHSLEFLKEGTAGQVNIHSISTDVIKTTNKMFDSGIDIIVAVNGKSWIGYVVYTPNYQNPLTGEKEGFIVELFVNPANRKNGVARALIESCIEDLKDKGLIVVGLNVFSKNMKARNLYESLGFAEFTTVMKNRIL